MLVCLRISFQESRAPAGRQRAAPSSSSGLQIFSDDPVLETAPPSLEIYSEFDQRTSSAAEPAGLDVYKDELDENAVPAPPPRLGVHREPLGSSDMATSDLQVWEDSDATAPASMDQSSVDPFAQADGLDLYRDDEFRTENLGQHVLAASSAEFARSEPEGEYPSDKENDVHPELAATRAPASMVVDEARALQVGVARVACQSTHVDDSGDLRWALRVLGRFIDVCKSLTALLMDGSLRMEWCSR